MEETKKGVADAFIFDNNSEEGTTKNKFIKGAEFDGEGLTLEVVSMEKFTPSEAKYGVVNEYGPGGIVTKANYFVKNGLLKEGETFKYTFKDSAGNYRSFDQKSAGFYFAFTKLNPPAGSVIVIKRNKESDKKVNWTIVKA